MPEFPLLAPEVQSDLTCIRSTNPPSRLDLLAATWLDAKAKRSGSDRTRRAYADGLGAFRTALQGAGLDLDGDPQLLAIAAQGWAGLGEPAPATFNQRLAILSSFYEFAIKHAVVARNPIRLVERRAVGDYAEARALDRDDLASQLAAIDRTTSAGRRDYALIAVYLQTGRRLSEVAALEWRDVRIVGQQIEIHFRRCKGGKVMDDRLPAPVARALLEWLQGHYGQLRDLRTDAPLWPSSSPRTRGRALSNQAIRDIVQARLGVTKVHSLRHTFAKAMEDAGAKVSDIQARLGHASLDTTGRYLRALKRSENAQAEDLARMFGLA